MTTSTDVNLIVSHSIPAAPQHIAQSHSRLCSPDFLNSSVVPGGSKAKACLNMD